MIAARKRVDNDTAIVERGKNQAEDAWIEGKQLVLQGRGLEVT